MSGVWLVLPTYNEAENIERVVPAVLAQLEGSGRPHRVLIVDDGSPDGTGALADGLAGRHAAVQVLHRRDKQGLGRAYLAGFELALAGGAELVMQMDADFSHDPADLPRLIAASGSADLVVGSRYVKGGGVTDWGRIRRLVSLGGSTYARLVLRVPVRDLTGGFKCFRREVLERLDLAGVHANGYGFQIELTYRTVKAGFSVTEVPIVFRNRQLGKSKMTPDIAMEAIWKVPALRFRR
ncbi:MAG TPA: polyprenol monophosphomannose synthase [Thermoleophilaceae bacterium]|nr:polyprenol monophosphomannose synthase [Thermoleophilaceae bacterium]